MATIVYIYNTSQLSLLLVTTEFQLSSERKNDTNATGGFMSSVSRGPANQAAYFLKYFYRRVTRKFSSSVVLDVGLYYFNVPVKSKLNDPSGVFKLLAGY